MRLLCSLCNAAPSYAQHHGWFHTGTSSGRARNAEASQRHYPMRTTVLGSVLVKLACESEARVMKSSTDCSEGGTNATAECKCHRAMRRRLCANGTNKLCSYAAIETVEESELLTASLSRAIVVAKYQRANVVARCQKSIDMQKMSKLEMRNRWGNQWIAKDKLRVDCNENTESRKHKIETRHTELRSLIC